MNSIGKLGSKYAAGKMTKPMQSCRYLKMGKSAQAINENIAEYAAELPRIRTVNRNYNARFSKIAKVPAWEIVGENLGGK